MDGDDALTGGTEEFARRLRRLEPAGHAIDRDALMFRAGERSAQHRLRFWQSLAGTMGLLVAGMGWLTAVLREPAASGGARPQPGRFPVALDAARPQPFPTDVMAVAPDRTGRLSFVLRAGQDRLSAGNYLKLRQRVALEGLDALPSSGTSPACPDTVQTIADWLRLPPTADPGSDPFAFSTAVMKGKPS